MSDDPQTNEDADEPVDLDEAILANAVAPASASNDRESASQHPLRDQLAIARHYERRANDPGRGKGRTIRSTRVVPPGAL